MLPGVALDAAATGRTPERVVVVGEEFGLPVVDLRAPDVLALALDFAAIHGYVADEVEIRLASP